MKNKLFINSIGTVLLAGAMVSCSSDYLDLSPETEIPTEDIASDVTSLRSATYGLFGNMYRQYSNLYDYRWFNGEPWLSMFYGEVPGQDYICYFWINSHRQVVNWEVMKDRNSNPNYIAWTYAYGIVGTANTLIAGTSNVEELDEEMKFRRAQCLTMRAHAYTRLLQIYGPRWTDSNNGEMLCIPLRLEPADINGETGCPLSSMKDVMAAIYNDLDEAIALFESTPSMGRTYEWETDIDVARGLYARAAMLKNDYVTAQKMAHDARAGYSIMTADEYQSGFAIPNGEWMWASQTGPAGIYYASFGASYACNGAYPTLWGSIGAGAIDVDLYRQLSPYDTRRQLFFTYDKGGLYLGAEDFYKTKNCNSASMNINRGDIKPQLLTFIQNQYNRLGAPNGWNPPYISPTTGEVVQLVQYGAQFKFWGIDSYSSSQFPYMRASEMLYIEAEAAFYNGEESTALTLLNQMNQARCSRYRPLTASGEALLNEIKISKRIELWGEGFSWFDMKRRGETMVRKPWVENDQTSGNWPSSMTSGDYSPESHNGWRWVIPDAEFQYNNMINYTELNYNE